MVLLYAEMPMRFTERTVKDIKVRLTIVKSLTFPIIFVIIADLLGRKLRPRRPGLLACRWSGIIPTGGRAPVGAPVRSERKHLRAIPQETTANYGAKIGGYPYCFLSVEVES